ncbi:MAG TPA: NigD-like N-terminal domain-containing protein [Saprospiraceae bacterium]|jgi:hypothetical protein|nr:NigD-like N-terminal domain-containing protein [Saprospiraceae bacterium]MCC6688917.1 NigD-like N-terminal domain-containing protein [Saprospiraceae bacterium]HMV23813.1 NigD-like N-terminal domain-containing protein [Saprospiraceae bacterium]HMX83856.1 NigD-like N-terminal domain-containing protein [Saprospiraceae bacterium]HMX85351.1 NigD-like N-terminal domain-containing protein [Saprospiraceae bacterium]
MIEKILLSCTFLLILSCNRTVVTNSGSQEETRATVKDMRDLDGCTYFLITDDGKKLLPNDLTVIPFSLMDGQRVLFTYKKAQNVAGICMAEDMIIDILSICIADKTTKPSKLQCIDMIDPVKTEWGRRLMNNQRVNKMWKFTYQDGFAYYFESQEKNLLYDCQGNLMCTDEPAKHNCIDNIAELTNGKIVWVLNH